jgi:hypothetical protein
MYMYIRVSILPHSTIFLLVFFFINFISYFLVSHSGFHYSFLKYNKTMLLFSLFEFTYVCSPPLNRLSLQYDHDHDGPVTDKEIADEIDKKKYQ